MGARRERKWQKFLQILGRISPSEMISHGGISRQLECVDLVLQIILGNPNIRATKVITQDTLKICKDAVCDWTSMAGRISKNSILKFSAGGGVNGGF